MRSSLRLNIIRCSFPTFYLTLCFSLLFSSVRSFLGNKPFLSQSYLYTRVNGLVQRSFYNNYHEMSFVWHGTTTNYIGKSCKTTKGFPSLVDRSSFSRLYYEPIGDDSNESNNDKNNRDSNNKDKSIPSPGSSSAASKSSASAEEEQLKLFKLKDFKPEDSADNIVQIPSDDPLLQEYKNQNNNGNKKRSEISPSSIIKDLQSSIVPTINMNLRMNDDKDEVPTGSKVDVMDQNGEYDPFEAQFMGEASMPKLYLIPQSQDERPRVLDSGTVQSKEEEGETGNEGDSTEGKTINEGAKENNVTKDDVDDTEARKDPASLLQSIVGNNIKRMSNKEENKVNTAEQKNDGDLSLFNSFKGSLEDVEKLADDKLLNEWEKETAEKKKKLREFNDNQIKNPQVNFLDNFGAKSVRKQSSSSSSFTPLNIARNKLSMTNKDKKKTENDYIDIDKEFQKVMKMADKADGKTGVNKAKATLKALSKDWRAWVGLLMVISLILAFTNALNYRSELVVWDTSETMPTHWSPIHQQVYLSLLMKDIGINFQS